MDCGDGADAGEEDRDAISRLNHEADAGKIRRQDVAFSGVERLFPAWRLADDHGAVAVNLRGAHDGKPVGREGAREAPREECSGGGLISRGRAATRKADEDSGRRIGRPEDPFAGGFFLEPVASHAGIVEAIDNGVGADGTVSPVPGGKGGKC